MKHDTWPKLRQIAHILQYVHDHTGKSHEPAMLHVNNMSDALDHGDSVTQVVTAYIDILVQRALKKPAAPRQRRLAP